MRYNQLVTEQKYYTLFERARGYLTLRLKIQPGQKY